MFMSMSSKTKASLPEFSKMSTTGLVVEGLDHLNYVFVGG